MDPIQEEKQALSQQEEFESRLFAEDDYAVMACVPVTKAGEIDRNGVPKQYFLVLTVNKNDKMDCKLHTVRIKNNGVDLKIQKSPKISKLKWFEITAENQHKITSATSWDFKLHWKNGTNEPFQLSPNTNRSVNLFNFIVYNVADRCCGHTVDIRPLESVELEVHGREWLDRLFNNNLLFRRINQVQQDIFGPIYKRLTSLTDEQSRGGNQRRLSMRTNNTDLLDGNGGGQGQQHKSMDLPLMTREETENIKKYMKICNVEIDNIHLLESKLMEKQRDLMRENIEAFELNETKLNTLLDNIDVSITSVTELVEYHFPTLCLYIDIPIKFGIPSLLSGGNVIYSQNPCTFHRNAVVEMSGQIQISLIF